MTVPDDNWGELPAGMRAAEIAWSRNPGNPYCFHATWEGSPMVLQLNDFPEEVMCSVYVAGDLVAEFDPFPARWQLPPRGTFTLN